MQTGITITTRQIKIVAMVAVLAIAVYAIGGDIYPTAPPGSTMKTLQEVYDAASAGVLEREGYCEQIGVNAGASTEVFTVPAGKMFVLRKLVVGHMSLYWSLRVQGASERTILWGEVCSIDGITWDTVRTLLDFPDRCVVVKAGETLKVHSHSPPGTVSIIGYFCDAP